MTAIETVNQLVALGSVRELAWVGQAGFVGNPGDSLVTVAPTIQLVFAPDVQIDPDRLVINLTARALAFWQFVAAAPDRLIFNWLGNEASRAFDFEIAVFQLPVQAKE